MKHLVLHSVAGLMGFISTGMGSAALGLECISRPAHLQWTSDRVKAKHGIRRRTRRGSISNAVKDIGVGVYFGFSGLVRQPVEGVHNDGVLGLLSGAGKGTVGVLALPAAGVARFFSKVAGGLGELAGPKELRKPHVRVRAPRVMEIEAAASQARLLNHVQHTLSTLGVDCLQEDVPRVVHLIDGKLYVLTDNHIVCLTAAREQQDCLAASVHWHVDLQHVISLTRSSEYVKIKYCTQFQQYEAEQDTTSSKTGSDIPDADSEVDDAPEHSMTGWQRLLHMKKRRIWCPSLDQRDLIFDEISNLMACKASSGSVFAQEQNFDMTFEDSPTDGCMEPAGKTEGEQQTVEHLASTQAPSQRSPHAGGDDGTESVDIFCNVCGYEMRKAGAQFCSRCGAAQC